MGQTTRYFSRYQIVFFFLATILVAVACSGCASSQPQPEQQQSSQQPDPVYPDISEGLEESFFVLSRAFFRAQTFSRSQESYAYLTVRGKNDRGEIKIGKLLSPPENGELQKGETIETLQLPEGFTFNVAQRTFWYPPQKGLQFQEEDQPLQIQGKAPTADFQVISAVEENPMRGFVNVVKNSVQIQTHVMVLE